MSREGRHAFIPDSRGDCIAKCALPKQHEIHQGIPMEDPRVPFDPEHERMRFECVIMDDGSMKVTFPPPAMEGMFWQMYVYLRDLAMQNFQDRKRGPDKPVIHRPW